MKIGDTIKTPVVPQKYTSFPNVITRLDRVIQKQPAIYFVAVGFKPTLRGRLKKLGVPFLQRFFKSRAGLNGEKHFLWIGQAPSRPMLSRCSLVA